MAYFLVINEEGPSWSDSRSMRDQELWTEHATFINALKDVAFVILGGPFGPGRPHRALLVVNSDNESAARAQLLEDPWMRAGILRIQSIEPWKILVSNDSLDPVLAEITKPAIPP